MLETNNCDVKQRDTQTKQKQCVKELCVQRARQNPDRASKHVHVQVTSDFLSLIQEVTVSHSTGSSLISQYDSVGFIGTKGKGDTTRVWALVRKNVLTLRPSVLAESESSDLVKDPVSK